MRIIGENGGAGARVAGANRQAVAAGPAEPREDVGHPFVGAFAAIGGRGAIATVS
jgi:hypothetical protein